MPLPLRVLLQVGYWLLYTALLALFFLLLSLQRVIGPFIEALIGWGTLMIGVAIIPGVLGFYAAFLYLFPRYLSPRRWIRLVGSLVVLSLLGAVVGTGLVSVLVSPAFWTTDGPWGGLTLVSILAWVTLINASIGLTLRGFISWYEAVQRNEALVQHTQAMELALIKSQLEPHFLFNTLHNIDVLIETDSAKASLYLNKLSDMLRFLLYETQSAKIPLVSELTYIETYVDCQRIRTANPDMIQVAIEGDASGWAIEPFLLIPFIENAFKHSPRLGTSLIWIELQIQANRLKFHCTNAIGVPNDVEAGGLGNALMDKRLALLYGNRYELVKVVDQQRYQVTLTIYQ